MGAKGPQVVYRRLMEDAIISLQILVHLEIRRGRMILDESGTEVSTEDRKDFGYRIEHSYGKVSRLTL